MIDCILWYGNQMIVWMLVQYSDSIWISTNQPSKLLKQFEHLVIWYFGPHCISKNENVGELIPRFVHLKFDNILTPLKMAFTRRYLQVTTQLFVLVL